MKKQTTVYKRYRSEHYEGEITKFIDKYIINDAEKIMLSEGYIGTYLWGLEENDKYRGTAFRYPGATRGFIKLNNDNIIEDIIFYPDTCFGEGRLEPFYYRKIIEDIKQFIGQELVFKESD